MALTLTALFYYKLIETSQIDSNPMGHIASQTVDQGHPMYKILICIHVNHMQQRIMSLASFYISLTQTHNSFFHQGITTLIGVRFKLGMVRYTQKRGKILRYFFFQPTLLLGLSTYMKQILFIGMLVCVKYVQTISNKFLLIYYLQMLPVKAPELLLRCF